MRQTSRFLLLGFFLLAVAASTPAQKYFGHVSSPSQSGFNPAGPGQAYGNGGYDSGYGYASYGYHSEHGHRSRGGYRSSTALEPGIGYAHGEDTAIASTYMEYDQDLALGKQMLEAEAHPTAVQAQPSLGEIARELRQGSSNPTSNGKTLTATQDGNGQLVICPDGARCQ